MNRNLTSSRPLTRLKIPKPQQKTGLANLIQKKVNATEYSLLHHSFSIPGDYP